MSLDMAAPAQGFVVVRVVGVAAVFQSRDVVRLEAAGLAAAPATVPVTYENLAPGCRPAPGIQAVMVAAHYSLSYSKF